MKNGLSVAASVSIGPPQSGHAGSAAAERLGSHRLGLGAHTWAIGIRQARLEFRPS